MQLNRDSQACTYNSALPLWAELHLRAAAQHVHALSLKSSLLLPATPPAAVNRCQKLGSKVQRSKPQRRTWLLRGHPWFQRLRIGKAGRASISVSSQIVKQPRVTELV
eukprot:1156876-Pelagomonas_calceolata.AAC.3